MTDEGSYSGDRVRLLIDRLNEGDDGAGDELINYTAERLVVLTRRMFRDYRRLSRWEECEDIGQNASMRLWSALKATRPSSPAEFHRLAALQIRRELIDQVRRYFGPEGMAANHASNAVDGVADSTPTPAYDVAESTDDPAKLARWAEFHERAATLPEPERAVFDLVWYQGLTQPQAATLLGLSERTLKRRWLAARISLGRALEDSPCRPGDLVTRP